jgi:hypothetical protein
MTRPDPYAFLDDIQKEREAERNADYSYAETPEQAEQSRQGLAVTPEAYKKFTPEEFFDG